jgi:hypothetical protein
LVAQSPVLVAIGGAGSNQPSVPQQPAKEQSKVTASKEKFGASFFHSYTTLTSANLVLPQKEIRLDKQRSTKSSKSSETVMMTF